MGLRRGQMVRIDEGNSKGTYGVVIYEDSEDGNNAVTVRTPYNGDIVMHGEDITPENK